MTVVYLVLGLPGAGRPEVVANLIDGGLADNPHVAIYHAASETDDLAPLAKSGAVLIPYTFQEGHFAIKPKTEPADEPETVFLLADGRLSAIDQIEAFPVLLQLKDWELGRIILVMDCSLAMAHSKVNEWHEACIHFCDVVLLNRRNALNHVWAQQFQKKFHDLRYPCVFAMVKNGKVDDAPMILYPEARRLTLTFDNIDPIDQLDLDEENLPEEPFTLENKIDPYFERLLSGHRVKPVPDVTEFLPK